MACHEDLFASDLIGRYLLKDGQTVWTDGPLARAVRMGAICYLDEVVEARKDTTVVIHPLTDDRRMLSIDKKGEIVPAHPDFMMVISYNPGYQSVLKDLKQSTRQRFAALSFDYPAPDREALIVAREAGAAPDLARRLVGLAGTHPQHPRARPGRRGQHPPADLRRAPDGRRHRAGRGLPHGHGPPPHR